MRWYRRLFRKRLVEKQLDSELWFHLDQQIADYVATGMSLEEARRRARLEFGGLDQAKEECRDVGAARFIETLIQDLRYGLRQLRRNPGFTAVAIITLALGIGATSTIFSWIDASLLNPIPGVANTNNMVSVMRGTISEHPSPPFSYPDYVDLRSHNRSFSGLLAYHDDFMSLTDHRKPERIYGALTSANYFSVLGVSLVLGRSFLPQNEATAGIAPVVVISYGFWKSRFGADPSVIGKTLQINRHNYSIIGVAPPRFEGCKTGLREDVWIPLVMDHQVWGSNRLEERGTFWLNVLGRLRPGVSRKQAAGELNVQMQHIAASTPNIQRGPNQITLDPLWRSPFGANVYLYRTLPLLLGLAAVLLLLACTNVANLLLLRLVPRRREIALRLAIGASRPRVMRQLMVESLVLALAGGAMAMLLTIWTAGAFASFFPPTTLPLAHKGHANPSVILATLVVAALTAMVFGALPALRTSRLAPVAVLKEEESRVSGGIHRSRLSKGMVVVQVALSLLLLTAAGLFVRSFRNEQRSNLGFDPNHVLLASYDLESVGYSPARGITFDRRLLDRLRVLPGVKSATLADFSPLNFTIHSDDVGPEGYVPQRRESMEVDSAVVSPDYFQTMNTPLAEGRGFTAHDEVKSQPVAIVNQEFCKRYWPGQDALGKTVTIDGRSLTVVGVARNAKYRLLHYAAQPTIFLPLYQSYRSQLTIHLRVAGDPGALFSAVARTVGEMNPRLPLFDVTTLKLSIQLGSVFARLAATLAGAFGLLALVLAAVGIYAVVAFATRQRTHEIGIRMALGAQPGDALKLVLGQGLKLAMIGIAVGVAVALGLARLLSGLLYGVKPTDPLTFAVVAVVLIGVTLLACYIPARRAAKVDPMVALRHE